VTELAVIVGAWFIGVPAVTIVAAIWTGRRRRRRSRAPGQSIPLLATLGKPSRIGFLMGKPELARGRDRCRVPPRSYRSEAPPAQNVGNRSQQDL